MDCNEVVKEQVVDFLEEAGIVENPESPTLLDRRLFTDGLLSSFQFTVLVVTIEEQLGRPLLESDLAVENFDTLRAIGSLMQRYAKVPRTGT